MSISEEAAWLDMARTGPVGHPEPAHVGQVGHPAELAVAQATTIEQLQIRLGETLAQFEACLDAAHRARDMAELDRDHWRTLAETLAARSPDSAPETGTPPAPRRSWWPWRR